MVVDHRWSFHVPPALTGIQLAFSNRSLVMLSLSVDQCTSTVPCTVNYPSLGLFLPPFAH